jgi:PAS domain S-box-containing protein
LHIRPMRTSNPENTVAPTDPVHFKRILARSVLLPLVLMALLAALFLWQISSLLSAAQAVEHTDEVISQANETQKLLIDMETGMRGYLIAGKPEFLEPYNRASQEINPALDELGRLVSDSPSQTSRVNAVRSQSATWMRYARDVIALKTAAGEFERRVTSGEGKQTMDSMRAQFDALIDQEETLRNGRAQDTRLATWVAVGSGLMAAILLGVILTIFIRRQLLAVSRSYLQALLSEQAQRQWLNITLTSIGDAVIVTDPEGRINLMNAVAESVVGWSTAEALGRPLPEVFKIVNEDTRAAVENPVTKVLRAGQIVGLANHTILIAKDGREVPIDDSGAPIRDHEGNIIGVVLVFRDITERKHFEMEREQLLANAQAAQQEAEAANRLKDEFLATASHELRTPLTAVVGWSRMLRGGKLDQETSARALESIERNANLQTRLIEDLLDISRIITGKLVLDRQPIEIPPVISDAVNTVRPAAEAKQITIETSFDPQAEPVLGDANRLQQVIWNLLANAVKFTPKGGHVFVALQRVDSQVEVSVRDTGEGIGAEFLPYVFDRFRQADGRSTRRHGGLGLGLAIVRHLVELHGGTVRAHSDGPGLGATISMRLPILAVFPVVSSSNQAGALAFTEEIGNERIAVTCPPNLDGVHVLIVDDDRDTRQMLNAVLSQCNAKVVTVASAAEALQEMTRLKPDVLVSDLGMPGQDGYDLIKKVRELESRLEIKAIPALALTAYAKAEDRVRALADGYQVHLAKPVEPAEFVLVVAKLVGRDNTSN